MSSASFFSTSPPQRSSTNPHFEFLARRRQQKKMSLTQTYYLAHTARKKLTTQAARADHDLRLLVGHANLLDTLMLELSDAEQEQEHWFNQTVSGATKASREEELFDEFPSAATTTSKRVQWTEKPVMEEPEDWNLEDVSDADSDVSDDEDDYGSDYDESDFVVNNNSYSASPSLSVVTPTPIPYGQDLSSLVTSTIVTEQEVDDDDDDDDDDYDGGSDSDSEFDEDDLEDLKGLRLTRSPSRHPCPQCPPDLASDSSSESEDDSLPPTPTHITYDSFDNKQSTDETKELTLSDSDHTDLFGHGQRYYASARPQQSTGTAIEAF